jgi:hypothetical protein
VEERRLVRVERGQREREQHRGDVLGTVPRDREQQQGERRADLVVEPPEQPEVEQRQPAVLGEDDVPAVRVGVVDAVERDLTDVGAEEIAREPLGLLLLEAVVGGYLLAVDPLEHEHPLGDVRPDNLGHDEVVVLLDRPRYQLCVRGLFHEVELAAEMHFELLREGAELEEAGGLGALFEKADGRPNDVEVELDLLHDPGPPHLDDDVPPVREEGAVDLGDRGGGERIRLEPGEDVGADVFAKNALDLRERKGGTSSTSFPSSAM